MTRSFTINTVPVRAPSAVQNKCNGVSFINLGTTVAVVQGIRILPLGSWTPFEPNPDELDNTNYLINFDATGAGPNPVNDLWVIRKTYE